MSSWRSYLTFTNIYYLLTYSFTFFWAGNNYKGYCGSTFYIFFGLWQVHSNCKSEMPSVCPLGQCKLSILPPTAINNIDSDGYWEATRPPRTSPLLVFVNTKSGDNQVSHGVRWRTGKTKQLACQVDVEKILLMIFVSSYRVWNFYVDLSSFWILLRCLI